MTNADERNRGPEGPVNEVSYTAEARRNDGTIEITVSPDWMSATASLYPPIGDGAPLTPDYASELLARLGVAKGVDWDFLRDEILKVNLDRHPSHGVVVAKGQAPGPEIPEHVVLEERFTDGFRPVDDDKRADWKSYSSVVVITKGGRIGTVIPAKAGFPGYDVRGKELPAGKSAVKDYSIGKNVEVVGGQVVSKVDGRVVVDGQKLSVEEVLVVKGDVDYRIGHVLFPGDVVIEGGVAVGFKVYSGGSIFIKETMDATDVSAKGDLECAQGLVGREQGFVRVGGSLKAKFIDGAKVAVRGDVEVPGSIVGSRIYTLGRLSMGDKGRIVGGEVFASRGVQCGWIGGHTNPVTAIHCGMDFTVQQKLDQANQALRALSVRLARLQELAAERDDAAAAKARDETETRMRALAANIAELSKRVDVDDGAYVEVKGGVYPGVTVTICRMHITVNEPLKKTLFRLDRVANRVVVEH